MAGKDGGIVFTHSMDGEVPLYIWEYPHPNIKREGGRSGDFGHTVFWKPMNSYNFLKLRINVF
jgi:hypothetical protein